VHVSRPLIDRFELSSEFVRPDESVTLRWKVRGADLISIESLLGKLEVAPEDSLVFAEPPYGDWRLRAYSSSGGEAAEVRILAPYVKVNEFYADPDRIVQGEPTTLRWDVAEVSEVEIFGLGTFPPQGEFELIPPDSRGYQLAATGPTDTEYRIAPVRVDVDASRPAMIGVSADPDHFVDGLSPLQQTFADGMPRYDVWVRIQDVLGSILLVSFALDIPDWLEVEEAESISYSALASSLTRYYWVRLDDCEPGTVRSQWLTRVRLKQIANPEPGEPRSIQIHPGMPDGSRPRAPIWSSCGTGLEFDFSVPGMKLSPGEPLTIIIGEVPIRSLPLRSRWVDAGLELIWDELPDVPFAELGLYRGHAPGELALVVSAEATGAWTDLEAPRLFESGPLFYQLIGRTTGGVIWQSREIEIHMAPTNSPVVRTRLLGARPNPFNPMTSFEFELERPGAVQLTVYDLAGRRVREWSLENQNIGLGRVTWDGTDQNGRRASSGVYLVRLQADGIVDTKRVTLLK